MQFPFSGSSKGGIKLLSRRYRKFKDTQISLIEMQIDLQNLLEFDLRNQGENVFRFATSTNRNNAGVYKLKVSQ